MGVDTFTKEYSDEELLKIATKRIKIKRSMYSHIISYVAVNLFLIFVYYVTKEPGDTDMPWFIWPLAGWGVGLILDIFRTIQDLSFTHNTRAVNKELEKIKRSLKN